MTRMLIVDDHEVLRDGVKRVFEKQPGMPTFGEASTVNEALRLVREQDWDVVVLDISLGDRSGLEALKELKQIRPQLPVLVLSMHSEGQFARRAFKAGAAGYVTLRVVHVASGRDLQGAVAEAPVSAVALAEPGGGQGGRGRHATPSF